MNQTKYSIAAVFLSLSFAQAQIQTPTPQSEKKIDEVVLKTSAKKSSQDHLMSLQRKSVGIVETVGADQLSKQGVGDLSAAVAKASGTLNIEGTGTFSVRGLLDRYNTTTLNHLPIPSENPENKNINLSIFKTGMIDYISIEKVFQPALSGDFGGANIDIVSKDYQGKKYFKFGIESSVNTQVFKPETFYLQQGPRFFGYQNTTTPHRSLAHYQVRNSWNFKDGFGPSNYTPLNSGINFETANNFKIGSTRLNTFLYAGWSNDYFYAKGREANYNSNGGRLNDYNVDKYSYSTNANALLNLFYKINQNHKLKFISTYIHATEQEVRTFQGYNYDWATNDNAYIRRAEYKTTDLFVNQLGGNHNLSEKLDLEWAIGYNYLDSKRPDRISNTLILQDNLYKVKRDGGSSNRYFDDLNDKELAANLSATYKLNDALKINAGYQGRSKKRDFMSQQYDFRYLPDFAQLAVVSDPNNLDAVFNQQRYNLGYFKIESNKLNPYNTSELLPITFNGKQDTHSGFANFEFQKEKLSVQVGVRADFIRQEMNWDTNYDLPDGSKSRDFNYQKFLPSVNAKYKLTDNQNIKVSASRTYTLPQMKELAPYMYENVTETTVGNPDLKPSDNNNLDLKWEIFPSKGEMFSVGAYGKYIQNPISKALVGEGLYSYLNVGDWAYVYGLEFEFRKDLYKTDRSKFYTFANASYLNSQSELDSEKIQKESSYYVSFDQGKTKDKLQGATNFVGNANLGYQFTTKSKTQIDLVASYAYVGEYVYAISTQEIGNIVQKPIHHLDLNLKIALPSQFEIGLKAKNILNTSIQREQQTGQNSITYDYKRGTEFGLSVGYKF